ncbi:MAG: molecular chaperone DnaK [Paenibacillus sp.]|nr:molecular chaperone DnaK [Paenibacillus sp.]
MSVLTKKQTSELKELLLQEKKDLEKHFEIEADRQGDSLRESTGELSTLDNHPADMATEVFERGRDQAIDDNLEHQLSNVKDALSRLENGGYGVCQECGSNIPFERLQAVPNTAYCMEHVPERGLTDYRPVEEEIMNPARGEMDPDSLTEQSNLDDNDTWSTVEQYGSSDSPVTTDNPDPLRDNGIDGIDKELVDIPKDKNI